MPELAPEEMLERTVHRWWILALLIVIGGLAGWIISRSRPPIYEATGIFEVALDQQVLVAEGRVSADDLPLDFSVVNEYLSSVNDMFYSGVVESVLVSDAKAQDLPLPGNGITASDFYIDRRGLRWLVTVRAEDPIVAANLVNLWLKASEIALSAAQEHASRAISLEAASSSIQKCFLAENFSKANLCAGTSFITITDLDGYLSDLQKQITTELQLGHGIDPALSFVIVSQAEPPTDPVLYSTGLMTLAGAMIGLLIGLVIVQVLPSKTP